MQQSWLKRADMCQHVVYVYYNIYSYAVMLLPKSGAPYSVTSDYSIIFPIIQSKLYIIFYENNINKHKKVYNAKRWLHCLNDFRLTQKCKLNII